MKKLLFITTFLLSLNAHAQWSVKHTQADELTGAIESCQYTYTTSTGVFQYDTNTNMYQIATTDGIFNTERISGYRGSSIIIGLYSSEDKLLDRITMWLDTPEGYPHVLRTRYASTMSTPVGQKKKVAKILNHLNQTTGYIRILAPLYGKPTLDLKVPHMSIE